MRFQKINGWSILEALVPIIVYHRPYPIVEIGAGASTIYLARVAEQFHVKLYSCDKSPRKNKVYFKDHVFVQKFSRDFIAEFDDYPVSVVLIDADHNYEVAKMEFDFFFDKLIPGGVIFLHDTMPPAEEYLTPTACGDVYKLRQELEKRDDLDCFTWPYTAGYMGLTMVMKKESDRKYWEL
uniref:Putative methyltransferase n=1 Tax=viral metagenome TaxID=1070528 RepID=A0A6H1ZPA4_9ZZZZ